MIGAKRPGFTIIELLIALLVLSILVRVATPAFARYTDMARAARVVSEIHAVRMAAYAYYLDTGKWPADVSRGVVPPELVPHLGTGFSFDRGVYMLDWDHWVLPDGSPSEPETGTLVGISLTTTDAAFGAAFVELLGENTARATIADHYTFVIIAAD